MQNIPGYPTSDAVVAPSVVVRRNGVAVPVTEVSITRELASDLPAQATTASGIVGATGTVRWGEAKAVRTKSASPWDGNGSVPAPMEPVEVDMGMNGVMVPQLRGHVKRSGGSFKDGKITSQLIDRISRLNTPVSFPAHMIVLPPYEEDGQFLHVNNTALFTTDRVLRACGFNATPPVDTGCVLSAPLMGSAWPEVGKVMFCSQVGAPDWPPSFSATQWGIGANSINAEYEPAMSSFGNNRLDKTLQITMKVRDVVPGYGFTDVSAWWGTSRVFLRVNPDRQVQAFFEDGTAVEVAFMSAVNAASADVFTLRITPAGVFTIFANNGQTATGNQALPAAYGTDNMRSVTIAQYSHLSSAHVGGVQVGFSTNPIWNSPVTAILSPPASGGGLPVMRRIENRAAIDVLKEQATAECASWWLDELGVLRWRNRNLLRGADPVETLPIRSKLLDLVYDSNDSGVRSKVVVRSDFATINRFPVSTVTLYTGRGEALRNGETNTEIIKPAQDEEWFMVNTTGGTHTQFNRGEGSMWGGIISKDGAADVWGFDVGKLETTVAPFNDGGDGYAVIITHEAMNMAAGETAVLKTSETDPFLKAFRRDKPLPIIRGKGRARLTEVFTTGAYLGPADAAALEHVVGPWVQDPMALQELADDLSAQLAEPRATLSDVPVLPDFRRQLGDVVWLEDPDDTGLRIRVLITGYTNTVNNGTGKASQTISARILENPLSPVTNSQLDAHAAEYSNAEFDTLWIGGTNAQLDADPLSRG